MELAASGGHFKGSAQCPQQRVARVTLEDWRSCSVGAMQTGGGPRAQVPETCIRRLDGDIFRRPGS